MDNPHLLIKGVGNVLSNKTKVGDNPLFAQVHMVYNTGYTKSKFRFSVFSRSLVGMLLIIFIGTLHRTGAKSGGINPACVPVADDWLYNNDGTPRTYQLGDENI